MSSPDVVYGRHSVKELLQSTVGVRQVLVAQEARAAPILDDIRRLASERSIEVIHTDRRRLDETARGVHQGVVALCEPFSYLSLDDVLGRDYGEACFLVLIDGVSDPRNLGSLIRSAEAAGVHALLIPRVRSSPVTPSARKVASGSAQRLPIATVSSAGSVLQILKRRGIWIAGLDPAGADRYDEIAFATEPLCLVLGSEGAGLGRLTKNRCDCLVRIPMAGAARSLGVSVAGATAMLDIRRQRASQHLKKES